MGDLRQGTWYAKALRLGALGHLDLDQHESAEISLEHVERRLAATLHPAKAEPSAHYVAVEDPYRVLEWFGRLAEEGPSLPFRAYFVFILSPCAVPKVPPSLTKRPW